MSIYPMILLSVKRGYIIAPERRSFKNRHRKFVQSQRMVLSFLQGGGIIKAVLRFQRSFTVYYRIRIYNYGVTNMEVSYKKLWKLLIDKDMKKKDLQSAAGISWSSVTKLSKGETVSMEVLMKICNALNCDIGDIMELLPEGTTEP